MSIIILHCIDFIRVRISKHSIIKQKCKLLYPVS